MIILYTFIKESYIDKYRSFVGGIIFMVMNESVENYLETILVLNHRLGNVRSIDIANEMNFKTKRQRSNEESPGKWLYYRKP